jgi:transcriptional regulator with XRE-family HTH domain
MHVGEIIHKVRKDRQVTLVELSSRSGVALATLSRIENGKMTGTLDSHMRIAEALQISLPDLYRNLNMSKKELEIHTKKTKTDVFMRDKDASSEMLATKVAGKKMMPVLIKLNRSGSTRREETRLGVEKFIYVLDGKVEAGIGDEKYTLAKGDTLYFESSVPHQFRNLITGQSRLISVTCPPTI